VEGPGSAALPEPGLQNGVEDYTTRLPTCVRQPEVQNLGVPTLRNEDVGGLNVAVDNAFRVSRRARRQSRCRATESTRSRWDARQCDASVSSRTHGNERVTVTRNVTVFGHVFAIMRFQSAHRVRDICARNDRITFEHAPRLPPADALDDALCNPGAPEITSG
jgi:hypothetical protein